MKQIESTPIVPPVAPPVATSQPAPRVVAFKPGIRIDFSAQRVEIDGEVILRMGELELFAYAAAPTPKEHETIVLLRVRPLDIYHALGLIGLEPGQPMSYDWETQTIHPAKGDPVRVSVRYEQDGATKTVSACDWLYDIQNERALPVRPWLFTGSTRLEDGRFAADLEGTVVTVVNFNTSLLGFSDSHSDSDSDLWLAANTDAIPPEGTKVVLVLEPYDPRP